MNSQTPVLDFGAHYHTSVPESFEALHDVIGPIATNPSKYADWFQDGGYDGAVLSQPYFLGYDDVSFTKKINNELFEIVENHDEFFGLAAIPTAAGGEEAAEEFERCLSMGYHGGAIAVEPNGVSITSDANSRTFEVANAYNAPILVHPTSNDRLSRSWVGDQHQNDMAFGREAALCSAISSVIHEGILERYPELSLVFHHSGGNIAAMLGRVDLRLDATRWGRSEQAISFEDFEAMLKSRIFVDTSGYFAYLNSLRCTTEVFEASQILLGTDAPYEPRSTGELQSYIDGIRNCTSGIDTDQILGGNALDILVNV